MGGKKGGAREGAGRPATGVKTKYYTVTLPVDEAEELEKRAKQCNKSINKYLRDLIRAGGQYSNLSVSHLCVDDISDEERHEKKIPYKEQYTLSESDFKIAAEEIKPYGKE